MIVEKIYIECPMCKSKCKLTPSEYEPTLANFECECGIMGTAHRFEEQETVNESQVLNANE